VTVLQAIGYAKGDNLYSKLRSQAIGAIIISGAGAVPGYLAAVLSVDTVGRKPLQLVGFTILVPLFCILGFAFHNFSNASRLALLVVIQFVLAAGPSTTVFTIPGEAFPTRYRATIHGVASACGKIGALMSQVASIRLLKNAETKCAESDALCAPQMNRLMQILALMVLLGALVTFLIPETRGVTLEELGGEPPTSYNAGRNGSIGRIIRHSRWNPFRGGQPAGFNYPRVQVIKMAARDAATAKRTASAGQESKKGSCSSSPGQKGKNMSSWPWTRGKKGDNVADSTVGNDAAPGGSVNPHGSGPGSGPGPGPTMTMAEVPNWGRGWGRIDRGAPRTRMDSIQLEDVSHLLADPGASSGSVSPLGGRSMDEERQSQ